MEFADIPSRGDPKKHHNENVWIWKDGRVSTEHVAPAAGLGLSFKHVQDKRNQTRTHKQARLRSRLRTSNLFTGSTLSSPSPLSPFPSPLYLSSLYDMRTAYWLHSPFLSMTCKQYINKLLNGAWKTRAVHNIYNKDDTRRSTL
jgi:hypothetical protein